MTAWVGLTGGIGSGKTQVSDAFAALGVPVLDADQVAHALTAPDGIALPLLRQAFGAAIFTDSGSLNRAALREQVFADATQKQRLEAILHPLILRQLQMAQARVCDAVYGLVVVPLLVELPLFLALADRVLVVDCPESVQVERVMRRSGLTETQVRAMMAQQATRAERLRAADDVLDNSGTVAAIAPKVAELNGFYRACFAAQPSRLDEEADL